MFVRNGAAMTGARKRRHVSNVPKSEVVSLTSGPPTFPNLTHKGRGSLNQPKVGRRADRVGCDHVEPIAGPLI
jgi:hypothetical protein